MQGVDSGTNLDFLFHTSSARMVFRRVLLVPNAGEIAQMRYVGYYEEALPEKHKAAQ